MELVIKVLIGFIAFLHLYIMWFEMFAWTTKGPKVFRGFPKSLFEPTKSMAANQGLYNGFLAAGLLWTFFISEPIWQDKVALFFLACVGIAGIFGALTADKKIFFIQTVPSFITSVLILI